MGKGRFALINHKDKIQDRCEECKKKWQKELAKQRLIKFRNKSKND